MTEIRKLDDKVSEVAVINGDYSIGIFTLGAILHKFSYKGHDIVVGHDRYEDYIPDLSDAYFSEVVGPFANRIANASFAIGDRRFSLEKNNGENNLHSGSKNFGSKYWKIESTDESSVRLSLESREEGGFPGNHHAEVEYSLSSDGELSISYSVSSDDICPVNVTNHAYFNLDGTGDIKAHKLTIGASRYLEVDSALIPLSVMDTAGTPFDFQSGAMIASRRDGKYDHCFIFDKGGKLSLENDEYVLTVSTDLPAIQVYTGEFLSSKAPGKDGKTIGAFSGVALESEFYPDFPNHPDYPGFYTEPGKPFMSKTVFHLVRK